MPNSAPNAGSPRGNAACHATGPSGRFIERVHSNIRQCVSRIDIMRMGHAMIRPAVGAIFSEERRRLKRLNDRILFANSDLSGISIFEEAQYHGVEAAQKVLKKLHG